MQEGKSPKAEDLFALTYATIFDVVGFVRKEAFWPLSKAEASKLGKVSVGCLNTIPEVAKAKVVKKFDKYLPWISLVAFGAAISYPRIQAAIENENQRKLVRFPAVPFAGKDAPAETIRSATPNGKPAGPSAVPTPIPTGVERLSTDAASGGSEKTNGTSFPPGHGVNFPKLDFEIPS